MSDEDVVAWVKFTQAVAYRFWSHFKGRASDWPEVRSEAMVCLVECASRFDASRGVPWKGFLAKNVRLRVLGYFRAERSRQDRTSLLELYASEGHLPSPQVREGPGRAEEIRIVVENLPIHLREAVEKRYGLNGNAPLSLAEAGRVLGIDKKAVSKREKSALSSLRRVLAGGLGIGLPPAVLREELSKVGRSGRRTPSRPCLTNNGC